MSYQVVKGKIKHAFLPYGGIRKVKEKKDYSLDFFDSEEDAISKAIELTSKGEHFYEVVEVE